MFGLLIMGKKSLVDERRAGWVLVLIVHEPSAYTNSSSVVQIYTYNISEAEAVVYSKTKLYFLPVYAV